MTVVLLFGQKNIIYIRVASMVQQYKKYGKKKRKLKKKV
jgi:hypothetical protein